MSIYHSARLIAEGWEFYGNLSRGDAKNIAGILWEYPEIHIDEAYPKSVRDECAIYLRGERQTVETMAETTFTGPKRILEEIFEGDEEHE